MLSQHISHRMKRQDSCSFCLFWELRARAIVYDGSVQRCTGLFVSLFLLSGPYGPLYAGRHVLCCSFFSLTISSCTSYRNVLCVLFLLQLSYFFSCKLACNRNFIFSLQIGLHLRFFLLHVGLYLKKFPSRKSSCS